MLQRAEYPFVIHPLWPDDTDSTADALAQLIIGGDHAAVLHGLERCLVSDVNLDSIVVFRLVYICNELLELILLFQGADQLACFLALAQLRILKRCWWRRWCKSEDLPRRPGWLRPPR